jgi:hypothetical protein
LKLLSVKDVISQTSACDNKNLQFHAALLFLCSLIIDLTRLVIEAIKRKPADRGGISEAKHLTPALS